MFWPFNAAITSFSERSSEAEEVAVSEELGEELAELSAEEAEALDVLWLLELALADDVSSLLLSSPPIMLQPESAKRAATEEAVTRVKRR